MTPKCLFLDDFPAATGDTDPAASGEISDMYHERERESHVVCQWIVPNEL